jgi:mRNA-degrading endonuclease RelE of RelBE toxin-antitoxin system
MTSKKEGPGRQKRSSGKPLSRVELSRTAESALKGVKEKDMKLIRELLSVIAADPFDRAHTVKLHGEWEGHRRAKKGDWRVIYLPPEEGTIYVVYIRNRTEKTYKK